MQILEFKCPQCKFETNHVEPIRAKCEFCWTENNPCLHQTLQLLNHKDMKHHV